jgi:hypothetical protein
MRHPALTPKYFPSTAKLTTTEFSNYIEAVRAWAVDMLDLKIPSPDEAFS